MAAEKEALSFDAMIQAGMYELHQPLAAKRDGLLTRYYFTDRQRRRNEALANEIMGKDRRASTPGAGANRRAMTGPGASLASRVGVTKVLTL